jgi:NADPH:quinone reductase-like Zn-dependent oxidoreductase/acyl carrier protein
VGSDVKDLKPGDDVVAVAPGCFGSFVTVPALFVVKKPAHISFEEAAAIPIVFLTTHYALNHQARLSADDRVLIHAAAGGVGLSAVQMAQKVGAEIFATAGSPEKRDLLRSLGVKHVMDSRSLDFADETMKITGGKGISVVLNSLAGDFIPKSISLLEPTGRFLEIGKIDLYQNSKLGLYPFRSGLSFFTIDMGWLLQHRPQLARSLLSELMQMFEDRSLTPLPVRSFSISEASTAFRFMAQAKHIGKIVLSIKDQQAVKVEPLPSKKTLFRGDATYLVTGGLRGFGLATAQWMTEQGAKHLMLVGRSGADSAEAAEAVAKLQAAGVDVQVVKADVSVEADVARVVAEIDRSMPPLRGVFHAAMVLDDGYLLQLNGGRFETVMGPKANGAWNLHTATLGKQLDCFVLFSSLASWAGSVGQGNYAAANAFLDALTHYRQAQKLPALTVNWGAIADVGYVARNPDIGKQLDRQGFLGLRPQEATTLLGQLLRRGQSEAGAIRVDFNNMAATFAGGGAAHRRFSHLLQQQTADAASGQAQGARRGEIFERLRSASPEEQLRALEGLLRHQASSVLGIPASRIDPEQNLANLGLDSLMSVELEMALETELGTDLPLGFFLGEEITLKSLSQRLREQIQAGLSAEESLSGQDTEISSSADSVVEEPEPVMVG